MAPGEKKKRYEVGSGVMKEPFLLLARVREGKLGVG